VDIPDWVVYDKWHTVYYYNKEKWWKHPKVRGKTPQDLEKLWYSGCHYDEYWQI
jgi:hypothetical protein